MKWINDHAFVQWLANRGYVEITENGIRMCMSGGVYLYMHEAWLGGSNGET